MNTRTSLGSAFLALSLVCGFHTDASAQVVEERESDSNPAAVLFKATLYGAGTGLLLGGAWALVDDENKNDEIKSTSTEDALKWGAAGGAVAGLLVGLVYVATRSGPKGSADEVGLLQLRDGDLHLSPQGLLTVPHARRGALNLNLASVRW